MKYRIKDWDKHYENAKSRTIEHKAWCPVPNKQDGLGYRRMLSERDGAALYGAFVAVILMASKQSLPREGYLTDTGRIDGIPHTPEALSLKTGIPSEIIEKMLALCCSQAVGWIEVMEASIPEGYCEDTTGTGGIRLKEGQEGQEGRYPLSEKSDNDAESQYSEEFELCWKEYPDKSGKNKAFDAFKKARRSGVTVDVIKDGIARYIKYVHQRQETDFRDLKFKNGATWFHQRCWKDEYVLAANPNDLSKDPTEGAI